MATRMTSLPRIALMAGVALTMASTPALAQSAGDGPTPRGPREVSPDAAAKLRASVKTSKARSLEQARQAELQRQEQARQWEETQRRNTAAEAARLEYEALADAEFEEERARKAAAWNANAKAQERALANSIDRLNNTVSRVEEQQAEATLRNREAAQEKEAADRRRQVELIDQATRRQYAEGDRLAAERGQSEQQRAQAKAAEAAATELRSADRLREQAAAERARLRQAANSTSAIPALGSGSAPAKAAGTPSAATASGGVMQTFLGKTCADARASAQSWVGNGSFKVVSEYTETGGTCRVGISYTSGTSTGIRQ